MAEDNRERPRQGQRPVRRQYVSPAVVDTAEFETLAQTCGKIDPAGGFACVANPTNS